MPLHRVSKESKEFTSTITVRLTEKQRAFAHMMADREGMDVSAYIRRLLVRVELALQLQ